MPGKRKIIRVVEEELDDKKNKTGWIKICRAIVPDCPVSIALNKEKDLGAYEILPDTIKWQTPEGQIISNKEREEHGGAIVTNSQKQISAFEKMASVMENVLKMQMDMKKEQEESKIQTQVQTQIQQVKK